MRAVIYSAFDDHIETFQMSEEELSEGGLGLRARGSSRATSHGQVLIQRSDNNGEREVPEEEGLEDLDAVWQQIITRGLKRGGE